MLNMQTAYRAPWFFISLAAVLFAQITFAADPPPAPPGPIAAKIQPFVDHHTLAGAVLLVANKDKILDIEAVGYADLIARKPMATDSLFWIASQSKSMTAAALMMLVDEGRIDVDDPVEKYLPEFKALTTVAQQIDGKRVLKPVTHPITIKNILTHTSGLPFKSEQMTSTQTDDLRNKGKDEYGYGFGLETWSKIHGDPKPGSGGAFGHGGAYSNEMHVSPGRNLIFVYMVQHNGYANDAGRQIYQTFEKTAVENFAQR